MSEDQNKQSPQIESDLDRNERILRNIASMIDKFEHSGVRTSIAIIESADYVERLLNQILDEKTKSVTPNTENLPALEVK